MELFVTLGVIWCLIALVRTPEVRAWWRRQGHGWEHTNARLFHASGISERENRAAIDTLLYLRSMVNADAIPQDALEAIMWKLHPEWMSQMELAVREGQRMKI